MAAIRRQWATNNDLAPPPRPESHLESAQDANDIYNLYGRDSWMPSDDTRVLGPTPSPRPRSRDLDHDDQEYLHGGSGYSPALADDSPRSEYYDAQPSFIVPDTTHDPTPAPAQVQDSALPVGFEGNALDTARRGESPGRTESPLGTSRRPSAQSSPAAGALPMRQPSGPHSQSAFRRPSGSSPLASRPTPSPSPKGPGCRPSDEEYEQGLASPGLDFSQPAAYVPFPAPSDTVPVSVPGTSPSAIPQHLREGPSTPQHETLSQLGTLTSSPRHPSITRINGPGMSAASSRVPSSASGMTNSTSDHSGGLNSGQGSSASLVSVKYPGEEQDAFHVRSTYARLEIEGVFGDGWDDGVERTRGGTATSGSRATVFLPSTDGGMTDQERQFISRLDRYGFVDTANRMRSEGRLAYVPASPLHKVPKLSLRSSLSPPQPRDNSQPLPITPMNPNAKPPPSPQTPPQRMPDGKKARRKEEERVSKWMRMMSVAARDKGGNVTSWRWSSEEGGKHRTRVYKGIPDRWRMAAWWTMAEARATKAGRTPSHESLEADYVSRRDQPSTSDVQIDLDVPRTISGHALFRTRFGHGQRALFHVLHVFSQACGTCGYCQGMGSVAATLLCYFDPERAYTLLVRLHDLYDMHGIYAPGFPGLLETFYVQERMMEQLMPDVYKIFQQNMISSSAWGAKIYITLFVNVVPFTTQLRLWDALWLDGYDVMVCAVLALLWSFRTLLGHPAATFESILSLLSSYFVPEDEDALMDWIQKLINQPGVREKMAAWRREWKGLVERGQDDVLL